MKELMTGNKINEKIRKLGRKALIFICVIAFGIILINTIMPSSNKSKNNDLSAQLDKKTEECRQLEMRVAMLETENQITLADKKALQDKFDAMTNEKYQISSDIRYLETKLASRLLLVTYDSSKEDLTTLHFTNATGTTNEVYINRKDKESGKSQLYNEFSDYISECKSDEMLIIAFVYDISKIHNKEYNLVSDVINLVKKENNNVLSLEKELSYSN